MSDKLVFDLASEVEGSPNVFIRKDWINILDNQNQNYNNNQSVLDTSQLSNSNKYMSYREGYLLVPLLLSISSTPQVAGADPGGWQPATSATSSDYAFGLKNWFGQIIHSFTLDYNGTTIIQQTPYLNMWNSFKLLTSLSYSDLQTQGATIGFFPDDSTSWVWTPAQAGPTLMMNYGNGVGNSPLSFAASDVPDPSNTFAGNKAGYCNNGYASRMRSINYDGDGTYFPNAAVPTNTYASLRTPGNTQILWNSYIFNKVNANTAGDPITNGRLSINITATIYLKHIHSFFNMCPLLKGVFMKMTMNLNNTTCKIVTGTGAAQVAGPSGAAGWQQFLIASEVQNAVGGVNPIMVSATGLASVPFENTAGALSQVNYQQGGRNLVPSPLAANTSRTYTMNISVGAKCLSSSVVGALDGLSAKSVYLYIPAYTFNPVFEQSYLSSPVKQIKYTDIYQYQVLGVGGGAQFNNLLTNGIANIKSVLIIPFFSSGVGSVLSTYNAVNGGVAAVTVTNSTNSGFISGIPVFQSPFDTAGCGTTSPMVSFSNFNVQISGQNAIYNVEKYNFEEWNNQLYGQNSVNGGMTDGITSGLIDRVGFDNNYCYYYVNVERMLPVEQSVPKSVQILGTNLSTRTVDLYCFIEYGVDISIDALTGARV